MTLDWSPWRRYLALATVACVLAGIGSSRFDPPIPSYRVGEFTDRSVRAPYDFVVTDDDATGRQRMEAARSSPVVVDVDAGATRVLEASIQQALDPLLTAIQSVGPPPEPIPASSSVRSRRAFDTSTRAHRRAIEAAIGSTLPEVERAVGAAAPPALHDLLQEDDAVSMLRASLDTIVADAYARPVVDDLAGVWSAVHVETEPEAYDVWLITGSAEQQARQPGALQELDSVRASMRSTAASQGGPMAVVEAWLRQAVAASLRPNAVVNVEATRLRRAAATEGVIPVSLSFRRNQLVVGEGQPVTPQTTLVLDYLRDQRSRQYSWTRLAVRAGLLFAALLLAFVAIDSSGLRFVDDHTTFAYGLTAISIAVLMFLAWDAFSGRALILVPGAPPLALMLAFPSAAMPMYTRLVAPQSTVARLLVAQALIFGLVWQGDARLAFFVLITGWVGSCLVAQCSRRQAVLRAGLVTGLVAAPVAAFLALDSSSLGAFGTNALAGLASGVLAALVVLAFGPVFELMFGHLTRIRLVELVNYAHPLLRRLTEMTPGTFQHSIGVGVLADAAARATGCDELLVRVAALYHDVGKTKQPQLFVENQQGWNPHDHMTPVESARNIIEHVPEGVRLLREHKIGERIVDFVREHHGTAAVNYFLVKARAADPTVARADFTYPGPSPRSLETLIVMLADQVEATARSMPDSGPEDLAAMVDRTIDRARLEGQIDYCPATFEDLRAIRQALITTLGGMAHRRIPYPGQPAPAVPVARASGIS